MRPRLRTPIAAAAAACALAAGVAAVAGAAKPGLQERIDSASSEASLISERISTQGARVAELEAEADQASAREAELSNQLAEATERSTELNSRLVAAERELDALRARYARSVRVLSDRLVAIYKTPEPDVLGVVLESDDYAELEGRTALLERLNDADGRIAGRVEALRNEVDARYEEIAGLKADIDSERQRLADAREQMAAEQAAAKDRAAEIASARSEAQAALSDLQERISGWELEVRKQAAEEISSGGGEAFLGGPYSIPTYIVMCESGGNYRALNESSMAGGAYQIIPSTWQAYGGQGQYAHLASKAEQDRVAAIIWREDGPGAWSCA